MKNNASILERIQKRNEQKGLSMNTQNGLTTFLNSVPINQSLSSPFQSQSTFENKNAKNVTDSKIIQKLVDTRSTDKSIPKYTNGNNEDKDTLPKQLLITEQQALAVGEIKGGTENIVKTCNEKIDNTDDEDKGRWFSCLQGGQTRKAKETERLLKEVIKGNIIQKQETRNNSIILQKSLQTLQNDLITVRDMINKSTQNVQESEKVLQRVQDASLEIERTRSEIILMKQEAKLLETNAEIVTREAQEAMKIEEMKKKRLLHGEIELALKIEKEAKEKSEEAHKLVQKEELILENLQQTERKHREEADIEQSRFSKLKSYVDILVLNAENATIASNEANLKLASLLENESKAQNTLLNYKEHAKEVIEKSKNLESTLLFNKDPYLLQSVLEIHAYETETATVILETMKLIEKMHEKIEKTLIRAKELEMIANQKTKEAKESQGTLSEYEVILKDALSKAIESLNELKKKELKFKELLSISAQYDIELEKASQDVRIKSAAKVEIEDEAKQSLKEMQQKFVEESLSSLSLSKSDTRTDIRTGSLTDTRTGSITNSLTDNSKNKVPKLKLQGGNSKFEKNGVFSKILGAVKNLNEKNIPFSNTPEFQQSVHEEISKHKLFF